LSYKLLRRWPSFKAGGWAGLVIVTTIAFPAQAQLFDSPVDRLPAAQRATLHEGQSLVTGEQGQYTARVLVSASVDRAWAVLTDYTNFAKFLPNVISCQVLKTNGNEKVIEQIDSRRVLLVTVKSRIRSVLTETAKTRIDFQLVEGDLKSLKGYWLIEPIAPFKGAKPNQVLISQVVEAEPPPGTPKGLFNDLFKDSLGQTLTAIGQEVSRPPR
jgi:ribosome-associated toxin RatA of RatAB toxin-antitoxin module